jgi:hypothetical protein
MTDSERKPERIDKCQIPWCNAPISGPEHFRDDLSRKEFHITGMCQKCQCEHVWRPAVKEVDQPTGYPFIVRRVSKPVRLCGKCEAVELLTQPEFYAQFGRMPW